VRLTVEDDNNNNNNGTLLLSFHYNIQISYKESYDTRHIAS